jgi:hypothetical protein
VIQSRGKPWSKIRANPWWGATPDADHRFEPILVKVPKAGKVMVPAPVPAAANIRDNDSTAITATTHARIGPTLLAPDLNEYTCPRPGSACNDAPPQKGWQSHFVMIIGSFHDPKKEPCLYQFGKGLKPILPRSLRFCPPFFSRRSDLG